jgi:lipid II:glycine glycyltransferase (peptidoglycan interpeptide bridge formation enzyme)
MSRGGNIVVQVVNQLDDETWGAFVDNHPQGNIFQTPEMFKVFQQAQKHDPSLWAAVDDSGQVLALFPSVLVQVSPYLGTLTTRNVAYGSVLCHPNPESWEALSNLILEYSQNNHNWLYTELRNLSDLSNLQQLLENQGFHYKDHLNYLIDISLPKENILQNIQKRTRKRIQRGMDKGAVIIKKVTNKKQLDDCYKLLHRSYTAAQVPLADYSLFEAAFDILYPRDEVLFTVAYVDGEPAATSVELLYKEVMYGWYGGVNRDFSAYVPNELLMWYLLCWGSDHGYAVYDFGGAGEPEEDYGVRQFKAKFGGELVCFGRNTLVHHPLLLKISQLGFKLGRHLYRKV